MSHGRYAADGCVRGDIPNDNRAGQNPGPVTDRTAGDHTGTNPQRYVVVNVYAPGESYGGFEEYTTSYNVVVLSDRSGR